MKKTKILVTAIAVSLGLGFNVQAKLPSKTIIIGNNVYDVGYLMSNPSNMEKANSELAGNTGSVYYVDTGDKAKDIMSGAMVSDKTVASKVGNTLTYYRADNRVQKILADSNGEFQNPTDTNTNVYAIVNVNYKKVIDPLLTFNFRINQLSGVDNASYFKVGSSTIVPIKDTATFMGRLSNDTMLSIYASDGITELANGQVNIDTKGANAGNKNLSVILNYSSAYNPNTNSTVKGNSAVNIVNTGFASIDKKGKWIYYINSGDRDKVYRKSVTGVDDFVISNDHAQYLNVIGDWVYYSNFDDNGKIYKVRIDGTQREKISNNTSSCLNAIGNKIYYINHSDGGKIYVLDSTGDHKVLDDSAKLLSIGDTHFIFYINSSDSNKLYSYDLLNDRKSKISDVDTQFINSVSDYLVFYTGRDGVLYRSTNSPGQQAIPMPVTTNIPQKSSKEGDMKSVDDKLTTICALSDRDIYYISAADKDKVYKLDDTGNGYKVLDDSADYINIVGDYMYYMKKGKLYVVPTSTTGKLKGDAVKKPKLTEKIVKLDPLNDIRVDDISNFSFPEKVTAIMSDGSIRELVVGWDRLHPKTSKGIYKYNGLVLGYNNRVTLTVALDSGIIDIEKNKPNIENLPGSKDTFELDKLEPGDLISIYDENDLTKPIKTARADKNGRVFISGLNLNPDGGNIYVSIQKADKAEGDKIPVIFPAEAPSGFIVDAQEQQITGLKEGKQYKVYLDNIDKDGKVPDVEDKGSNKAQLLATVVADDNGTIKVNGLKAKVENSKDKKQMLRLVLSGTTDSKPSTGIQVSQAQIPDYVDIDFNLGRIMGTTSDMKFTYDVDKDGKPKSSASWYDCQSGTTPISLTRSLQIAIKIGARGPVIESEPKAYGLFPAPKVTGIENGKIYGLYGKDNTEKENNLPKPMWPSKQDLGNNSTIEYVAKLQKGEETPVEIKNEKEFAAKILDKKDGKYKLIVTATKTVPGMEPGSAKNSTIVNFEVSSAIPAPVEITMLENKGTDEKSIDTYYSATPTWLDLAGTYSKVTLKMTKEPNKDSKPGAALNYKEVAKPAEVAFIKGTTITQPGEYELKVITISRENGSESTSIKKFKVDNINKALMPEVTGVYEGGIYNRTLDKGVEIKDKNNCITEATLMRDGYTTKYISGKEITINGNYVLILKTTNKINGHTIENRISFRIDSKASGTTQNAPTVTFKFGDKKLSGAKIGMEYSLNGGASWNDVVVDDQVLTKNEINILNNDSNNKLMIRVKKDGNTPASAPTIIKLEKQDKPKEVKCTFNDKGECTITGADEYSIDGGITWHASNDIDSTSINIGNGVWGRMKASGDKKASEPYKAKITKAAAPNVKVNINSSEVKIQDTTENMQYSVDNGLIWKNATNDNTVISDKLDSSKGILIRMKASGAAMPGYETKIEVLSKPECAFDFVDKKLKNMDSSMLWSKDGKTNWTEIGDAEKVNEYINNEVKGKKEPTIYIRKKSTDKSIGLSQELKVKLPTKVTLDGGLGVADNGKITGLTSEKKYVVTVDGEKKGIDKNGKIVNLKDAASLQKGITEITGLDNTKTYKVEEVE